MKKRSTLWLFNIAMENCPFTDDIPIKTSIYNGFSIAMLVITRWLAMANRLTPFLETPFSPQKIGRGTMGIKKKPSTEIGTIFVFT